MDLKTKFIFLLGIMLIVLSSLVYAQELRVLEHIPAEEVGNGYNLAISPDGIGKQKRGQIFHLDIIVNNKDLTPYLIPYM